MVTQWKECSPEQYAFSLECLPPQRWNKLGFLVGEPSSRRKCRVTFKTAETYPAFSRIDGQPYSLTYDQAVKAAKTIAQRKGFGVVIMRRFDRMAHADDVHPGTDTVISFPVDAKGVRLDWPTAWRIRNTLATR